MTYYEYVILIENNKTGPRNENIFNTLNAINYEGPILNRITNHLIGLIKSRLQNSFDLFVNNLTNQKLDVSLFSTGLSELKNEFNYIAGFTKLNILKEYESSLKSQIILFIDDIELTMKNTFGNIDNNEIISIINSLNLKEGII